MKTLNYGKIKWSYEDGFNPSLPCSPSPFLSFSAIRINGKLKTPQFSEKVTLALLKLSGKKKQAFQEAYKEWYLNHQWTDKDLGEGRAFYRWLKKNDLKLLFSPSEVQLHPYFKQKDGPTHEVNDELAPDHSFAIKAVKVAGRSVKLYLMDEAVISLMNLPFGKETDFLELVESYIQERFEWEKWRAPAPPFLDWVKSQGRRPVFLKGQLGFHFPGSF